MGKVKIYRTIGYIFLAIGILSFISGTCQSCSSKQVIANPVVVGFLLFLYALLMGLAFNIFLWAGLLFLRKSDKLENPDKESKWNKIIRPYKKLLIVALIVLLISIILNKLIILPYILRVSQEIMFKK